MLNTLALLSAASASSASPSAHHPHAKGAALHQPRHMMKATTQYTSSEEYEEALQNIDAAITHIITEYENTNFNASEPVNYYDDSNFDFDAFSVNYTTTYALEIGMHYHVETTHECDHDDGSILSWVFA